MNIATLPNFSSFKVPMIDCWVITRLDRWTRDEHFLHCLCVQADFRQQMLGAVKVFSDSPRNGLFINSCFAHCQTERQDTWFAEDSPLIANKARSNIVLWFYLNLLFFNLNRNIHFFSGAGNSGFCWRLVLWSDTG